MAREPVFASHIPMHGQRQPEGTGVVGSLFNNAVSTVAFI